MRPSAGARKIGGSNDGGTACRNSTRTVTGACNAQFDTQRLADRIEQKLFRKALTDEDKAFIERLDLFFLATVNSNGEPSCSYKGGDPGFVRVLESRAR